MHSPAQEVLDQAAADREVDPSVQLVARTAMCVPYAEPAKPRRPVSGDATLTPPVPER